MTPKFVNTKRQLLVESVQDRHLLYGTFAGSLLASTKNVMKLYSDCHDEDKRLLDEQIVHKKPYFYLQGCKLNGKDVDYTWEIRDIASNELILSRDVYINSALMTIDLGQIEFTSENKTDSLPSSTHLYILIQILSLFVFYYTLKYCISNHYRKKNVTVPSIVSPFRPMSKSSITKIVRFNTDENEVENPTESSMIGLMTLDIFDSESWKFIQK